MVDHALESPVPLLQRAAEEYVLEQGVDLLLAAKTAHAIDTLS